jgi:CRISPR-associated endoribonuclease Cas6
MESSIGQATPAKLYALRLKLRPMERGTLMPFSGELIHAAWLDWIRAAAPDVAEALHDGNKQRVFTCSSLQFPLPIYRLREAEYENVHLPVDPEKTYSVRLTLLLGELFPLFYDSLMHFNMASFGTKQPPFMQIGKRTFLLEEVITTDDQAGWTGFTTFSNLVERVKARQLDRVEPLTLEFASLTAFSRGGQKGKDYGNYYARLPLPQFIFPGLAKRWLELAPAELASIVQKERIEQYIQEDGIIIDDYDLRTHYVTFVKHPQRGFVGTCTYHLRGPDEETTPEAPLTVRQQLLLLAQLAFYTGIGYKTAMGLGQSRSVEGMVKRGTSQHERS